MPTDRRPWTEIAEGVYVRRYAFFDQNIVAVVEGGEALVVDTRSTMGQAQEILDDLRAVGAPRVSAVVNTHGHFDHAFGNARFRPAPIWGHERAAAMLAPNGRQRAHATAEVPSLADAFAELELDPPDCMFADSAVVPLGRRLVHLAFLGRGHTDNDIVIAVEGTDVLCVGDLLENGAPPYYGDGFPLDWTATAHAILARTGPSTVVVPGHGDHAGRAFVERQLAEIEAIATLARQVHAGELDLEAAVARAPWPADKSRTAIERGLAQLRGDLD